MAFYVKFWGVRGSLPFSPSPQNWVSDIRKIMYGFFAAGFKTAKDIDHFLMNQKVTRIGGYGTGTTSVEVNVGETQIIIDGGSGIKRLGDSMMNNGHGREKKPIHIFLTHFHWDHLIGLPFFVPIFLPGQEIHFYAVQDDLEPIIRSLFRKPVFPVPYEALGARLIFHRLEPRVPIEIGEASLTPYLLDHPDPCWGFKITGENKAYAHCVDTEGTRTSRESLGPDLPLYQGIDLMFYDAQYTLPELAEKINWGHSAAQIGLDIGFREGIKKILFSHHDPGASTDQIVALEEQTREYYQWMMDNAKRTKKQLPHIEWGFAYEEQRVQL